MRELSEHEKKLDEIIKNSKFVPKQDTLYVKLHLTPHALSMEEQKYFRRITSDIFGLNEQSRSEAFHELEHSYQIILIIPYLSIFIRETIECNIVLTDLTLLIYSVRMVKSLLGNEYVDLKPYLHEVIPFILSCILSKKLSRYYQDNHWSLRDFSATVMVDIGKKYSDDLNHINLRVKKIYLQGIADEKKCLTTLYGSIRGLGSFGEEAIKKYLMPNIGWIGRRLLYAEEMTGHVYLANDFQKQILNEMNHVKSGVLNILTPVLYKVQNSNDGGISYMKQFGYFGKALYIEVKKLESFKNIRSSQPNVQENVQPGPSTQTRMPIQNPPVLMQPPMNICPSIMFPSMRNIPRARFNTRSHIPWKF